MPVPTTQASWSADRERTLWRTYARTSHLLNLVIMVLDTAYVLATWNTGAHRELLLWLNAVAAVGVVAAVLVVPEEKVAESPRRNLIFGSWALVGTGFITLAAWADGGLSSPLTWLLPLSIMFSAVAHRPQMVAWSGGLAVAAFFALALTDGAVSSTPAATMLWLAYLIVLTYIAASGARARWAHHDEQLRAHEHLSELADLDGLTGLLNHRAFHQRLTAHLERCNNLGAAVTVLIADLDHFKGINDRHGHGVGDEVLQAVAAAISEAVRPTDTVGRVGGEEFAVYLGSIPASEAHAIAERVRVNVGSITNPEPLTASVGIGSSDGGRLTSAELLARADEALYTAKRQGRNRTCWLRVA